MNPIAKCNNSYCSRVRRPRFYIENLKKFPDIIDRIPIGYTSDTCYLRRSAYLLRGIWRKLLREMRTKCFCQSLVMRPKRNVSSPKILQATNQTETEMSKNVLSLDSKIAHLASRL